MVGGCSREGVEGAKLEDPGWVTTGSKYGFSSAGLDLFLLLLLLLVAILLSLSRDLRVVVGQ